MQSSNSNDYDDMSKTGPDQERRLAGGGKKGRRSGRRSSGRVDMKAKLERSRQSARECRARKKLRYQYLEELVISREKSVFALHKELEMYKHWAQELQQGRIPPEAIQHLADGIKKEPDAQPTDQE